MSHIFISYSRRDLDFAQKIVDALGQEGLETWIDWKSIPKGEDWEQEIYEGIEGSDAFLFLISTDSIKSVMCNKEIVHAIKNNKRILPILLYEVDTEDFLDETARAEIKRLNWIFCRRDEDDFAQAIETTRETIRTNYDWLRFHTSLQTKALAWERARKDGSRLLRGKELKEAKEKIASTKVGTEPFLTDLQRQFMTKSRQAVRRRQSLPLRVILGLAVAIFLGGKFFYLFIPISSDCPQVGRVAVSFEGSGLPNDVLERLLAASEDGLSATKMRNCDPGVEETIHAGAVYEPGTSRIGLSASLPETPAYRLDFLQEIREFGPELVSEEQATALLRAFAAYSVGEYQAAIDLLDGHESLTALTLLAQARLFTDDLPGSRTTYDMALQKPQPDEAYTSKLYTGAALAWWRPESYYILSFEGNKDYCKTAAGYYAKAQDWIESDKLAHNIRIAYAGFCITSDDESDPGYAPYAEWKHDSPQSEPDPEAKDARLTNAVANLIEAVRLGADKPETRAQYEDHLISAQALMLARAKLSDFYWGTQDNCTAAKTARDEFRSGIYSDLEKGKLQSLLQSQPLFCR